jgi:hypothetical protein
MKTCQNETWWQRRFLRSAYLPLIVSAVVLLSLPLLAAPALAQQLFQDNHYWYAPEHEKHSHSEFFAEPSFDSARVPITRLTRFRYVQGSRNWAKLEFDGGNIAFIPLRLLRLVMYDPAASDPWYEFKRASVFSEQPSKIEARLKSPVPAVEPRSADSKTPVWKRYKERWGVNQGRPPAPTVEGEAGEEPPRTADKKARNPYPLLTPIGPQTGVQAPRAPDASASETDRQSSTP